MAYPDDSQAEFIVRTTSPSGFQECRVGYDERHVRRIVSGLKGTNTARVEVFKVAELTEMPELGWAKP